MKVKIIKDHWNYKKGETVEVAEGRAVYLKKVQAAEELKEPNEADLDEEEMVAFPIEDNEMITNDAGKPLQAEIPKKVIKVKPQDENKNNKK